jgi:hypothetical protein
MAWLDPGAEATANSMAATTLKPIVAALASPQRDPRRAAFSGSPIMVRTLANERDRVNPLRPRLPPLLADVERMPVLQVEMKMGAVDVVELRPKDGGEDAARTLMHPAQKLGLWGRGLSD